MTIIYSNTYLTFDDILKKIESFDHSDLHKWINLIGTHYLTEKEHKIYTMLKAYYSEDIGQRELSVFCNLPQGHISVAFKLLIKNIHILYDFLSAEALKQEYRECMQLARLSAMQKSYLKYILAGHDKHKLMIIFDVSLLAVTRYINRLYKLLLKINKFTVITDFILYYKKHQHGSYNV